MVSPGNARIAALKTDWGINEESRAPGMGRKAPHRPDNPLRMDSKDFLKDTAALQILCIAVVACAAYIHDSAKEGQVSQNRLFIEIPVRPPALPEMISGGMSNAVKIFVQPWYYNVFVKPLGFAEQIQVGVKTGDLSFLKFSK
jgi:hypothetical protein